MPQLSAFLSMQASSSSSSSSKAAVSASMERTSQWVSSQDVPTDLVVRVAGAAFPLHKAVMVAKCGYIRRAVAEAARFADPAAAVEVELDGMPGGADAFEKAARYCYGANFEISARNAAALRCAAAFLDMADGAGGLARRVEEFLAQAGLRTLPSAVAVLRSCEGLLPAAEELGVVRRAADAVALRVCNEALFPTRSPPEWWTAELAALSPASFHRVLTALRCRRADPEVIVTAATAYAELLLADQVVVADGDAGPGARALLESIVAILPSADDAPLPVAFLCRLLHAAVTVEASAETRRDLELRVAAVLDQATAGDLLGVALDGVGERAVHIETVQRVIAAFVERESSPTGGRSRSRRASLSGAELGAGALQKVARTVDEVAAEVAMEESLPISKFVSLAGAVPREARAAQDSLYRAVDVYLKTHPALDEIEREKVCSVMDPLKLSHTARLHAAQNKRLPLQAVLSALYYDQLKLRSAAGDEGEDDGVRSEAGSARMQAKADAALARENEALRSELARMRAHLSGGGGVPQQSKGSGSRTAAAAAKGTKKKAGFFGSVSRTLSRMNPFRAGGGWSKDTSSIADRAAMHVVKPKTRRSSIG